MNRDPQRRGLSIVTDGAIVSGRRGNHAVGPFRPPPYSDETSPVRFYGYPAGGAGAIGSQDGAGSVNFI